jgi:hypothetical protein
MIGMHLTDAADWADIPSKITHLRLWDCGVTWRDIHLGPDTYDWTRLDQLVSSAGGRHVVYTVGACPQWLAKYPDQPHYAPWLGPGSNSMPYDVEAFNGFMWNLATRYRGRIHAYEIWNEPQLADFLYPYTDAECNALAAMTKRAYNTVKACDPAAMVLAASVLPRESSGGMKRARRYMDAVKSKGYPFDAWTTHLYPEIDTGYKRWRSMLDDTVATIDAYQSPTRKLWITETNYGLLGHTIPDSKADQLVTDTYAGAGGRFVYWYAWRRPDLGGMQIGPDTAAWTAIKREG